METTVTAAICIDYETHRFDMESVLQSVANGRQPRHTHTGNRGNGFFLSGDRLSFCSYAKHAVMVWAVSLGTQMCIRGIREKFGRDHDSDFAKYSFAVIVIESTIECCIGIAGLRDKCY